MFEVRIRGRGGEGAVTAADLLSVAASLDGRHLRACDGPGLPPAVRDRLEPR